MVSVGVNFLAPLLVQTPGVIRTVAVTMDLVPTDVAMTHGHDRPDDGRRRTRRPPRRPAVPPTRATTGSCRQAELRAHDLAQGAGGVRAVGYVTVSARSVEELEQAKRRMRTAAARSWL